MPHAYIADVLASVQVRNPYQPEFLQAVREVFDDVAIVLERRPEYRRERILERFVEPERQILFRVPWVDDSGAVRVNRGFRVEFSSAIGIYKGGLRFHSSVTLSIIKFLGFEQILKNALTTLPMGGAKGGADFNFRGKSDGEIMRFCQSFMTELARHIGPDVDVPAGDIGVGGRELGFLFGQYKRMVNRWDAALTGKTLGCGGSLMRPEATGYGLVYFAQEMLATRGQSFEGKRVALSGYGNVGGFALEKLNELGAKPVTIADEEGFIHDPDGITGEKVRFVQDMWSLRRAPVSEYAERFGVAYSKGRPWHAPCDVALPTAAQNEIDEADAGALVDNGCLAVAEGANMPCTPEAIAVFQNAGLLYAPGKAANAGGVAVSGLEITQNVIRMPWTRQEVDERLRRIMQNIHKVCLDTAEHFGKPGNYLAGANIAGFTKVADAMLAQGVV